MIIAVQTRIPRMGTKGTNGVLNGLIRFGSVLRKINTPIQTNTNANNVPIDVRSPAILDGRNAANKPTNTKRIILLLYGVLNFGWSVEKTFGSNPSVDMV